MDKLFFVIFPEEGVWVAHGLQKNIVTHGESLQEIRENIVALLECYRTHANPETLERLPEAPQVYWERFCEAVKADRYLDKYLGAEPTVKQSVWELQTA